VAHEAETIAGGAHGGLTPAGIAAAGGVTNVILSTPISTLTTGAVVTVTPSQSRRVYQVSASSPITLTNNLTALGANCTTNYEWETWINYTATNALSTVWDSRIQWQQQTPDLTVTGLYKFAMSTACGTIIQARQTWPTVHPWEVAEFSSTYNGAPTYGNIRFAFTNNVTNIVFFSGPASVYHLRAGDAPTDTLIFMAKLRHDYEPTEGYFSGWLGWSCGNPLSANRAPVQQYAINSNSVTKVLAKSIFAFGTTSVAQNLYAGKRFGIVVAATNVFSAVEVYVDYPVVRLPNELETRAYSAGWRP
jgi:hypothetical protein